MCSVSLSAAAGSLLPTSMKPQGPRSQQSSLFSSSHHNLLNLLLNAQLICAHCHGNDSSAIFG
jgi:cytochrome c553